MRPTRHGEALGDCVLHGQIDVLAEVKLGLQGGVRVALVNEAGAQGHRLADCAESLRGANRDGFVYLVCQLVADSLELVGQTDTDEQLIYSGVCDRKIKVVERANWGVSLHNGTDGDVVIAGGDGSREVFEISSSAHRHGAMGVLVLQGQLLFVVGV